MSSHPPPFCSLGLPHAPGMAARSAEEVAALMGTEQSPRAPPVLLPHTSEGDTGHARHPEDGKGQPVSTTACLTPSLPAAFQPA